MSDQHSAMLRYLMDRAGSRPLLTLTPAPGDGELPVLTLSVAVDGQRLMLGVVDFTGDAAVVALPPEALRAIVAAVSGWLADL